MINVLLSGACGKMGQTVSLTTLNDSDIKIVCGVDKADLICDYPVFHSFDDVNIKPDVIIDFSIASALDDILKFAVANSTPVVLCTTGYSKEQIEIIKETSKKIPIFFSFNMSIGVNLLCSISKKVSSVLGDDFDIEIVEKHHNQKIDAPSGTAIMLANAINEQSYEKYRYEYDRHSKRQKRSKNEIGIHSIRGGNIVGEHDVIFAGEDEVITLSHSANSKKIFAKGAIKASKFIVGKPSGLYDMNDIFNF